MKKVFKYILIFLSLFALLIILKNLLLFYSYKHDVKGFIKIEGDRNDIVGIWNTDYDTFEGGYDIKRYWKLIINEDSTGVLITKSHLNKIFGGAASTYSWRSLLPFKKKEDFYHKTKVKLIKDYILFATDSTSLWQAKDTLYSKYIIRNDSLLIDRNRRLNKYSDNPKWGFYYSFKPKFVEMFKFWFL